MALSLKDPETDRLARDRLARERLRRGQPAKGFAEALDALALECAALPHLDDRSADEILGYDQTGMWR
jgi:antitoxin VapB